MKKIDITEMLELDGNPHLTFKGEEIEVNTSAAVMLKILAMAENTTMSENQKTMKAYELIFSEESRKMMESELSFKDLKAIIKKAMELVRGDEDDDKGEDQTRTTT